MPLDQVQASKPAGVDALLAKYGGPVPRYTSYPTALHFTAAVDDATYGAWLRDLPEKGALSLYLHVPFCDALCLYCGCNTTVARQEAPRRAYAALLEREIGMVAARLGGRRPVRAIHWGGGTPTALPADCLTRLDALLRRSFDVAADAEICMELDPRHLAEDRLQALAAMGLTRASLGVQDLDAAVQQAVGRVQPVECVQAAISRLRGIGVRSINLDLIYGLPLQTEASVIRTAQAIVGLQADRIAAFGYAHVPWIKRQQALMPTDALPSPSARFAQCAAIALVLVAAGYQAVGMDHFARPGDTLALAHGDGTVRRNFQGYTADAAPVLLGFGASAIGSLPQGYAQNAAAVPAYRDAIEAGRLAVIRGVSLSDDDRLRRDVIEAVMCSGAVDLVAVAAGNNADPAGLMELAGLLDAFVADGLVVRSPTGMAVTTAGRPFLRCVAAVFDAYHPGTAFRHSAAV